MYLRTIPGDTWIPGLTNNSLAIRSSRRTGFSLGHTGFSLSILH